MCDSFQDMNLCALGFYAEGNDRSNILSDNEESKRKSSDRMKPPVGNVCGQSIFEGDEENQRIDFNSCTSTQQNTLNGENKIELYSDLTSSVTMNDETRRTDQDERRDHVSNHRCIDSTSSRQRDQCSSARVQGQVALTEISNHTKLRFETLRKKKQQKDADNYSKTSSTSSKTNRSYRSPKLSRLTKKLFSLKRMSSSTEENLRNWRKENVPSISQMKTMYIDDSVLVEFCGRGFYSPSDVRIALENDPTMAKVVSPDGRNALHAICIKGLPIRKSTVVSLQDHSFNFESMKTVIHQDQLSHDHKKQSSFLQRKENQLNPFDFTPCETEYVAKTPFRILKEDARNFKDVLKILVESNPMGVAKLDKNGDLPVHLLVRQLWDWKSKMKPRTKRSQKERIIFGEIMMIVRDCIEILLKPLTNNKECCHATGSNGVLLPLHIGAIYNVSLAIFEGLLSGHEETAAIATIGALEGLENRLPLDLFGSKLLIEFETNRQRRENIQRTSDFILACNSNLPFDRLEHLVVKIEQKSSSWEENSDSLL